MFLKPVIGNCISVAVPVLNGEGISSDAIMGNLSDLGDDVDHGIVVILRFRCRGLGRDRLFISGVKSWHR